MYTSIKAYSKDKFIEFYNSIGGNKEYNDINIIFDEIYFNGTKITFYSNLTILFNGPINEDLSLKIDIIIDKELYVGSDEVGVGESIGPIVASAVRFKSYEHKRKAILNGIKDSKKLNAKEIKEKADFLKDCVEHYSITIEPIKFNEIYKKNPNVKAINAIIQNELHKKFENMNYKHVTDQFVNQNKYKEYLVNSGNEEFKGELLLLTKAEEKFLEVSVAAIISKDIFNDWVINEFKKQGVNLEVGNKLNSWAIYQDLLADKYDVDKTIFIKEWKKI